MKVWIQRSDFSSEDSVVASADEAVARLLAFDWKAEVQREEQALADGEDCCPAGMGLVAEYGDILHIIPQAEGSAMIHYHYSSPRSVLGILKWQQAHNLTVHGFPTSGLLALMRLHFEGGRQSEMAAMLETEGHS